MNDDQRDSISSNRKVKNGSRINICGLGLARHQNSLRCSFLLKRPQIHMRRKELLWQTPKFNDYLLCLKQGRLLRSTIFCSEIFDRQS
jgi:hypothetical protein